MAVDQEQLIRGLLQLAENLSSGLPLEVRLTDLCCTTVRLLGCDRSSIFLREGRHYRAKYNHGNPPDIAAGFPQFKVSLRDPLISQAMQTRSFVVVNDAQHSALMNAQTARRGRIQSIVVAPLFDDRGEPLGFITAEYNENPGSFTEIMSTLVLGFAKLADLACLADRHAAERQRAEEALRRLNRTLRAISECSQAVVRAASEPELLQAICRIVVERGGYRMAWVGFAAADEAKTVRPVAHAGFDEGYLDALHITYADTELGCGPPGTAIREGQVCACRDILSDPRFAPWRDEALRRGYGSSIALPLLGDGKAFGALNIYSARPDAFDAEEERLLTDLAKDLAYGITALRTRAERERAEAALRESEERFRALVNQSLTGIGVIQDDRTVYANPRLAEMAGYQQDEMLRVSPFEFVVEADRELVRENLRRRLSGEVRGVHYTLGSRRKDGTEIEVEVYGNLITYNGRPAVLSTLLDITERKRVEEALRESETRFRELFNNMSSGVAVYEASNDGHTFTFTDFNRAAERIEATPREALLGRSVVEVFPGVRDFGLLDVFQRVWRTGQPEHHPAVIYHDERIVGWRENYVYKLPSGEIVAVYDDITARKQAETALRESQERLLLRLAGTAQDITDRKRAEEAWRLSEERFATLFRASPDAITLTSLSTGRIHEVNKGASRLTGYTREELIGHTTQELHIWANAADRERYVSLLQQDGRATNFEADFRTKSGELQTSLVSGELIKFQDSQYILAVIRNITERKQAEEERQRLQAALQRSEMMAAIGALVAGVAHEARNPLFGISATLDAFEARFGQEPKSAQYLSVLRGEANRLNDLMRDLLDYGRPPSPVLVPGSIVTVIAEAVAACAPLAREADVQVAMTTVEGIAPLAMDAGRLPRVFQNLLQNAIQQSPRGGTVTVEVAEACDDSRAWIECIVKDSGPGFREEDLPRRIFEPFFSHRKGGTGLGLSIVERIVADHHGTVSAVNRPEGGAAVAVRLPAAV